jgi:hypothetical protein
VVSVIRPKHSIITRARLTLSIELDRTLLPALIRTGLPSEMRLRGSANSDQKMYGAKAAA